MIKQVIWSSTIDWTNQLSTVLFFGGCNFNCDYCHNRELDKQEDIPFDDILEKLIERKPIVDHIILSGGEPTVSNGYFDILKKLRDNGFKVGIHTNGSKPFVVLDSIDKYGVSFVGLDIKAGSDASYSDHFIGSYSSFSFCNALYTLYFLSQRKDRVDIDVRTTLGKYLSELELIKIGKKLSNYVNEWNLQYEVQEGKQIKYLNAKQYENVVDGLRHFIKINFR